MLGHHLGPPRLLTHRPQQLPARPTACSRQGRPSWEGGRPSSRMQNTTLPHSSFSFFADSADSVPDSNEDYEDEVV